MVEQTIFKKYEELKKRLKAEIFGQDEAIEELIESLIHIHLSPIKQNFKGLLTFLGPHNSGKVYTATLLAELCEDFEAVKVFDMAEYTDPNDQKKLIGDQGSLTRFLRKNPRSILIFKDIEKADNVIQLAILNFLRSPSFESGVELKETLVIFTSTLATPLIKREDFLHFYKKNRLKAQAKIVEFIAKEKKIIYDVVESAIDPELLNLIVQNYIILFRHLSFNAIVKVARKILKKSIEEFGEKTGVSISIDPKTLKLLVLSFAPYINARRIHRKIPDILIDLIYEAIRKSAIEPKTIRFEATEEAAQILKKVDQDFLRSLTKKNQTIELAWRFETEGSRLRIIVQKATIKKIPFYITSAEKPYIQYSTVSFKDVAGQKNVKASLKEIVKVIQNPALTKRFGISMPKGLLLYGPKGVGKTLLSMAFINELDLPFILLAGSDLFDTGLIHSAFEKAKELSPAVILLDGLDANEQIIPPYDAIAKEIDAVSEEEYVFTLCTAEDKSNIDKNLLASERIDIIIEVPELDMEARKFFIKKILEKPNDGKIDIDKVARYMSGLSGYEMQRVAKEAALYVIRKNLSQITEEILIEQINDIKYGQKVDKKRIRNLEKDIKKTAYHEAGHAVLSYILLPDVKIEQVTITPRAETLGFVSYSDEFISNVSKEELFNDICVALAGRIAKIKKFPDEGEDTGAAQDLQQATWEAYNLVATFGMDEKIGYIDIDTLTQNVSKELFVKELQERIAYWIDKATKKSQELVERHWEKIERVAAELIKKEVIDGEELRRIMES